MRKSLDPDQTLPEVLSGSTPFAIPSGINWKRYGKSTLLNVYIERLQH